MAKVLYGGGNMKKCAKCGKENIDEAVYCANCGASLELRSANFILFKLPPTTPDKQDRQMKIWCCYVPIILFILILAFSVVHHQFAESFPTDYGDDFDYLDLNGDEKLSFDEISIVNWNMSDSKISEYFNEADTNNNGFLKGHEFDIFGDNVKNYHRHSEDSSSSSDKYKYSSSSSSSGSSSNGRDYNTGNSKATNSLNNQEFDRSEGYVLTCPYCGSEAVYETGGHYRCAECGRNIYNPDDLELGYWEGYMELISPVSLLIA